MALEAQNNPFTSVLMVGAADPEALPDADPSAGSYRFVIDDTGAAWIVDSSGVATAVGGASGAVATDAIWDAAGDLVQGTGANTAAKLTAGTAGMVLKSAGAAAANLWAYPPGYEYDYAQITSNTNVTATAEGSADTIITGNAVTYDGSTIVIVEAFFPYCQQSGPDANTLLVLYDGSSSIGYMNLGTNPNATGYSGNTRFPGFGGKRRITPSNASHTYSIRAFVSAGTGVLAAGAGGSGAYPPAFIRITKV